VKRKGASYVSVVGIELPNLGAMEVRSSVDLGDVVYMRLKQL
jgi:hypothetical protein